MSDEQKIFETPDKGLTRYLHDLQQRVEELERFALMNQNHETRLRLLEKQIALADFKSRF